MSGRELFKNNSVSLEPHQMSVLIEHFGLSISNHRLYLRAYLKTEF